MLLPPFELHRPESVAEATALAARLGDDFDWIAGGTDLLPNYKWRLNPRRHVIALHRVAELRGIARGDDGSFRIGAFVRLRDLERHPGVRASLPCIAETLGQLASSSLRESGTLGGNLCLDTRCFYFNQSGFWRGAKGGCLKEGGPICLVVPSQKVRVCYAAFSGDLAPVLQVMRAGVGIAGPAGARTVALTDFYRRDGIERFVLAKGELLTHVDIPAQPRAARVGYRKLRQRDAIDFPILGVAASVELERDEEVVRDVRISVTGVDSIPVVLAALAAERGKRVTPAWIDRIARMVFDEVQPVKNVSLRPAYRRKMAAVFTKRLLNDLTKHEATVVALTSG